MVEVNSYSIDSRTLSVFIGSNKFILNAATVNELLLIPGCPLKSTAAGNIKLFVLSQDSFYTARKKPGIFIRTLIETEINELFNVYLYRKTEGSIPESTFPDISRSDFKYKYVVIKDSVILNSGVFSKHWLVQLKTLEIKKNSSDSSLFKICKWEGCMSPLVTEADLAKMITDFNMSANKATISTKKGLNPLKKVRTASEAIIVTDLCIFHNNIRNVMRKEGLIIKSYINDTYTELWKACQAGLNWQEHLSESNKLSHLISGTVKASLCTYFEDYNSNVPITPLNTTYSESSISQKALLLKQIESLKVKNMQNIKECEINCTNDLRRIFMSGATNSYLKVMDMQYTLVPIQEALVLQTTSKFNKLRTLRDQLESFVALKIPNYIENSVVNQVSFRVSTAKPIELNNTYNDSSKKLKDEAYKKTVSPYYEPKLRIIKRFQKLKVPRTAGDDRLNKAPDYTNTL
jgi:hypothetical protein